MPTYAWAASTRPAEAGAGIEPGTRRTKKQAHFEALTTRKHFAPFFLNTII